MRFPKNLSASNHKLFSELSSELFLRCRRRIFFEVGFWKLFRWLNLGFFFSGWWNFLSLSLHDVFLLMRCGGLCLWRWWWFYLFVCWWCPLVLVVVVGRCCWWWSWWWWCPSGCGGLVVVVVVITLGGSAFVWSSFGRCWWWLCVRCMMFYKVL